MFKMEYILGDLPGKVTINFASDFLPTYVILPSMDALILKLLKITTKKVK